MAEVTATVGPTDANFQRAIIGRMLEPLFNRYPGAHDSWTMHAERQPDGSVLIVLEQTEERCLEQHDVYIGPGLGRPVRVRCDRPARHLGLHWRTQGGDTHSWVDDVADLPID